MKQLTGRAMITAGMRDAPHLPEAVINEVRDKTPMHLRAAVIDGDPTMGAGNVYQVPRSDIEYDYIRNSKGKYIDVPAHWKRIGGLDVGFNCTAFVCLAHDTDSDVIYLIDEYVVHHQPPAVIRQGIKYRKGDKFPIMIDPAANGRSQMDGKKLISEYRGPPNDRIDVRSAENAVEAGIHRVWELLSTGRLKIFKHCTATLKEYEMYHRDINGKVVKKNDHCLHPDTVVHTSGGGYRIADLVGTKGKVLTSDGSYTDYQHCRKTAENQKIVSVFLEDGSKVVCTPDHKFLTDEGWVEASGLLGKTVVQYNAQVTIPQDNEICKSPLSHLRVKNFSEHVAAPVLVRCLAVRNSGKSDVYCLEVPETHAFAVNGGTIVHNCMDALRYAVMGIRQAKLIYQNDDVTSTYKNPYSFGNT